jgi:hypothetical protein
MRAWIVSPILGVVLIALAISSVEARGMMGHGGHVSRHVVSRHVVASPGRFVVVSNSRTRDRVFVFDRFSRRFVAFRHRDFDQFRRSTPFGFVDGFGGFGDFGSPAAVSEAPPGVDFIEPQPAPLGTAAALPPCHETTSVGVVIERGIACSRVGAAN